MEICQEEGSGHQGATGAQSRVDACCGSEDESDTGAILGPGPQVADGGDALQPEDDEFEGDGAPPFGPQSSDDDFWDQ